MYGIKGEGMADWIVVVDDNMANLQMAGTVLSKANKKVSAMKSGQRLLTFMKENEPDLILLDIMMPEMDGFETLRRLREQEKEMGRDPVPVIFLTADEDSNTERRGFEEGVSDYIRKPFNPEVLLRRVENIVSKEEKLQNLKTEANIDRLTGLLNKGAAAQEFARCCREWTGCLMMIDLDSFKLVNDLYGHEMGDKILIAFSEIIKKYIPLGSRSARVGGDEFSAFAKGMSDEVQLTNFARHLNQDLIAEAKRLMGDDMPIPLGASVGGILVPEHGRNYEELLRKTDKMLYIVKQNGKHGSRLYKGDETEEESVGQEADIASIMAVLSERSIPNTALQVDKDSFPYVYRYIMRYIVRNHRSIGNVLLTLTKSESGIDQEQYSELCDQFAIHIRETLRKSDIFMRYKKNQYFVVLMDMHKDSFETVVKNVISKWMEAHPTELLVGYEIFFSEIPEGETGGQPA